MVNVFCHLLPNERPCIQYLLFKYQMELKPIHAKETELISMNYIQYGDKFDFGVGHGRHMFTEKKN